MPRINRYRLRGGLAANLGVILGSINCRLPAVKNLVPFIVLRFIARRCFSQISQYADLPERRWITEQVLPRLARAGLERVVFVGSAPYTFHYEYFFDRRKTQFVTIDRNPSGRVWGAKNHIIDDVCNISSHLPRRSVDVVLIIGVYGFGLYRSNLGLAMKAVASILKSGGVLIFSWNSDVSSDPIEHEAFVGFRHSAAFGLPERKSFSGYHLVLDVFTHLPQTV